jgi:hypothetical protein
LTKTCTRIGVYSGDCYFFTELDMVLYGRLQMRDRSRLLTRGHYKTLVAEAGYRKTIKGVALTHPEPPFDNYGMRNQK